MASGWGAMLQSVAGPVAKKVLSAIGIGTITYIGLDAAVNSALGAAKATLSGIGGDVLSLLAMGGLFASMSIIAGGMVARVSMIALKRFEKIA